MKRLLTVGLLAGLIAFAAPKPATAGVHVSVGVGLPGFGAVVTTGPVYAPYPYAYGQAPYAYVPVPAYVAPVYYPGAYYRPHWHARPYPVRAYRYHRHCH